MTANQAGDAVTNFYCSQVGRTRNINAEFNILRNWQDAIDAEISESESEPQWVMDMLLGMKEQCELFLSEIN